MMSFLFRCLCCLLVIDISISRGEKMFELRLDRSFGIHGCRQHCEKIKDCFNVKYSPNTLSCVLKLNVSSDVKEQKDTGFDVRVQRLVRTRSGRFVGVCEFYETGQLECENTVLSFIPMNKDLCKVSGKQNNILEPTPEASWATPCMARIDPTFSRNVKYSWTVTVRLTNDVLANVRFQFKSQEGKALSRFSLVKRGRHFQFTSTKAPTKTLYCQATMTLKFTLSNGILHVIAANTKATMLTKSFQRNVGDNIYLLCKMFVAKSIDFQILLNK